MIITVFHLGLLVLSATGQYNVQVGATDQLSPDQVAGLESFWWNQPSDSTDNQEPNVVSSNEPIPETKSGGILEESVSCSTGTDCVNHLICVNGVIDVSGGDLISKRIKSSTCGGDNVCCRIPGYIEPLGEDQCHYNEDCVAYNICTPQGVIDINGGSLLDKRTGIKPPSTCINYEFPEVPAVCCLRPYKCPEYQVCVNDYHCGADGLIDTSGSLQSYFTGGIKCISDDQSIEGVCCVPPAEIKDAFPLPGSCGIRNENNLDPHIQTGYGKEDADFGEFPWQAIIFLSSDKEELLFKCAAVLISDRHLLTAAHCVEFLHPKDIGVRLGEYEVSSVKELKPYVDKEVYKITVHPDYKPTSTHYNLALIELTTSVHFDYHINPICLANAHHTFTSKCVATGWGKDHFEGSYQHILKKLELPYVDHERCQNLLRQTILSKYFVLHKSLACAGGEAGRDTCTGDGGGPLACYDSITKQYYLAGIVNAGLKCGEVNVPGLYANVPYMTDWIDSVIAGGAYQEPSSAPSYGR